MGYEVFTAYGAGSRLEASLRASGYLFVPRAMMEAIGAEDSKELVLMYDKETQMLAIRAPVEEDLQRARREAIIERSGTAINIIPILRVNGFVQPTKKQKLPAEVSEVDQFVEVDMSAAATKSLL